jgi:HTH-type transcriptional regulator, transcriptional repressor of NAD biosynthesis genes
MSGLRRTRGLLLGKFMPPHQGHLHLTDFARAFLGKGELTVVVGTLAREPIPGDLRFEWMRELASSFANVVHLTDDLPQEPSEHPDFWNIWQTVLKRIHPQEIDYVFASEPYGAKLAEVLGAEFVPVDLGRKGVPVSATAIRNDPFTHWDHIPRCVRPYFVKRVVCFGPESTGKTTLASDLAAHYNTIYVPEYARTLLETVPPPAAATGSPVNRAMMTSIMMGQRASEQALARSANRLLFLDTDVLTPTIWWKVLLGEECPGYHARDAFAERYDLTFLTDIDVPWKADPIRYRPDDRAGFLGQCEATLHAANRPYVRLRGSREERLRTAVQIIDSQLL